MPELNPCFDSAAAHDFRTTLRLCTRSSKSSIRTARHTGCREFETCHQSLDPSSGLSRQVFLPNQAKLFPLMPAVAALLSNVSLGFGKEKNLNN